ncbi:MAG: hypothetical protein VX372_03395 [Verrucomicrobiota bacterium]|nr:hypothetical protein [Verrucomicrobiota bacterium]
MFTLIQRPKAVLQLENGLIYKRVAKKHGYLATASEFTLAANDLETTQSECSSVVLLLRLRTLVWKGKPAEKFKF